MSCVGAVLLMKCHIHFIGSRGDINFKKPFQQINYDYDVIILSG